MKLITHNLLTSRFLKNVQTGYPLKLAVDKFEEIKTDYNQEFLQKMLNKVDYNALKEAAQVCGQKLPDTLPDTNSPNKEDDLKVIHKALFDIEIITGTLECPESGRKFPISDGIPNMLCNEDE
uniref:Multifunctional methyltransferase subunit TRM112-like protein n=1 Tax=Aceria tosichella TaxID=561515 RepID=A0A6G1SEY9_9ACAR